MKKITVYSVLICIVLLSAFSLTACNSDDKGYVLPSGTDVESITLRLPETRTDYTVTGDDLEQLVKSLKSQSKLEKDETVFNVGKESVSRRAIYSVTITTKKKFLSKSKTYTVSIGSVTDRTDMYGKKSTATDKDELRITGYNGTATSDLTALVAKIADREDMKIITDYYDRVRAKFVDEGYTVTDKEFNDNVSLDGHPYLNSANDVKGFKAVKDEAWINVILCKTATIAYNYTNNGQNGGSAYRVYYGGNSDAYATLKSVSKT